MQIATDFIVLSSSPETSAIYTPPLPVGDSKKTSLRDPSLSPSPSPPASLSVPTRSRFFSTPPYSPSKTLDRITKDAHKKRTTTDGNSAPSEGNPKRRGRKPQPTSQAELEGIGQRDLENKENAPTKPKRARKKQERSGVGGENSKNKTISGKVTKSGVSRPRTSVVKPGDSEKITCQRNPGREEMHGCEEGDLQLELVITRRRDWTPTKLPANTVVSLDDQNDAAIGQDGLGTLLSGYGYAGRTTASDRHKVLTDSGPTKRRRIELVNSRVLPPKPKSFFKDHSVQNSEGNAPICAASKPSKKSKPKSKRLTTLTARVTASYEASADRSDATEQESLVTTESSMGAKSKTARKKRKADADPEYKVLRTILSPEEAVKSLDQQDLVFGTCSQLQRGDFPTLLRDTQVALQESEKELTKGLCQPSQTARYSSAISRLTARKNLWSVAARDAEGQLANIEVVDLVDSPETFKPNALSLNDDNGNDKDQNAAIEPSSSSDVLLAKPLATTDASSNKELPAATSHTVEQSQCGQPKARPKPPMPYYRGKTSLQLALEVQSYGLKPPKNREKLIELLEKCWVAKHGPAAHVANEEPLSNITVETTSFSSEPNKVEQDPMNKQTKTVTRRKTVNGQSHPQPNASEPTKRSRETTITTAAANDNKQYSPERKARERLNSKRSFIDVEEIQDSEDELFSSPSAILNQLLIRPSRKEVKNKSKNQKRQELPTSTFPSSPSPRGPLALASLASPSRQTKTDTSPPVSADRELLDLGEQITKAVRAQPWRSQSTAATGTRKRPSWHEKILMYDPIYLEDFTAWLNTEGLALVDEDREVAISFVRQWCESKGICCCFRVRKTAEHL
ncbi:structure-specific endonuclease subunit slx4 [Aspergillus desertorum]